MHLMDCEALNENFHRNAGNLTRTAKPSWDAVGIEWKLDQNLFLQDCNNFLSPNQTKHNLKKPEQTKWTKLDQTQHNKPIWTKQNKTVLNQWKQIDQTR